MYDSQTKANTTYYRYVQATSSETQQGQRRRLQESWRMYAGLYNGQWDSSLVEQLTNLRMPVHTYNFVQPVVDTVKGHILQSPIDAQITTLVPADQEEVSAMQTLLDIDMRQSDFEKIESTWIRDGLIHTGIVQLYVDTDKDVRGSIAFRVVDPNYIYFSPSWITEDLADCDEVFRSEWMSAQQIKAVYGTKSAEIDELIEQYNLATSGFGSMDEADKIAERSPDFYDRNRERFRVIERIYIEETSERVVVDLWTSQEVDKKAMVESDDDSIYETALNVEESAKTGEKSKRYAVKRKRVRKTKVCTICPAISYSLELAKGDYPLQCGQVPFELWSFNQAHGERWGIPDVLRDPQRVLNIRNSQLTKMLNQKVNGSYQVESDAFDTPEQLNQFRLNAAKSGQVHVVATGTNQGNKIKAMNDAIDVTDLVQSTNSQVEFISQLIQVAPLMQAQKQVGHDSGVLYEATRADSLVPFETLLNTYKAAKRKLIHLYIKAAVDWYGTAPRIFFDVDRGVQVALNLPQVDPATGELKEIKLRDASWYQAEMLMLRVGNAKRLQELGQSAMLLKSTDIPAVRGAFQRRIIELTPMPEENRKAILASIDEYIKTQDEIQKAQAAEAQAKAQQAQQAANPPAPPAPAPQMTQAPGMMEQMMASMGGGAGGA